MTTQRGFKRGSVMLREMGRGWCDICRHRLQISSRMRALGARAPHFAGGPVVHVDKSIRATLEYALF
jgi:hypothetical protein